MRSQFGCTKLDLLALVYGVYLLSSTVAHAGNPGRPEPLTSGDVLRVALEAVKSNEIESHGPAIDLSTPRVLRYASPVAVLRGFRVRTDKDRALKEIIEAGCLIARFYNFKNETPGDWTAAQPDLTAAEKELGDACVAVNSREYGRVIDRPRGKTLKDLVRGSLSKAAYAWARANKGVEVSVEKTLTAADLFQVPVRVPSGTRVRYAQQTMKRLADLMEDRDESIWIDVTDNQVLELNGIYIFRVYRGNEFAEYNKDVGPSTKEIVLE